MNDIITMPALIVALVIGIVAAALFELGKYFVQNLIYKRSEYSGNWINYIYGESGEIIKVDKLKIKHNKKTEEFKGSIIRKVPLSHTHRKWKCKGVFYKNVMLMVFWPKENIHSYGVAYFQHFQQDEDYKYSGYYLKYKEAEKDIEKVKIDIKQVDFESDDCLYFQQRQKQQAEVATTADTKKGD